MRTTIAKVENIEVSEFDMPDQGVYILTGANCSDKTTFLKTLSKQHQLKHATRKLTTAYRNW